MIAPAHRTLFSGYLTLREFEEGQNRFGVLSGPGHDVAVVTCVACTEAGDFRFVVKLGDTRPARSLRNRPYVREGLVAGRLDHANHGPEDIAVVEVREEVGGRVLRSPVRLGAHPSPTMPVVSTEADIHLLASVGFEPGVRPTGDGGGMEVAALLDYALRTPSEILDAIHLGRMSEGCRSRVAFGRAFEKLGLLPAVPVVQAQLRPGDPTLALGPVLDISDWRSDPTGPRPDLQNGDEARRIDGVVLNILEEVAMDRPPGRLLRARARHSVGGQESGEPFLVEILDTFFDEIEIIPYRLDGHGIPWVGLDQSSSPVLSAKACLLDEVQSGAPTPQSLWSGCVTFADPAHADATAVSLAESLHFGPPEIVIRSDPSPGQSTLREHGYVAYCPSSSPGWERIDDAIRKLRQEGGTARTEAILLELAARTF